MTEYRVVCDRDEHHNLDGTEHHYESVAVHFNGRAHNFHYRDKALAEKALEEAKRECPKQDAKSDNDRCYGIRRKQYNFRIQSREVTEWE